jgi:hypothetical protein
MSYMIPIGILGLLAIAACWALAVVLYRVGTTGSVARKLAVLLVVEGFVLATAGFPEFAFAVPLNIYDSRPALLFFWLLVHHLCDAAMISLYPPFLALALNTKLTRPFENKRVRIGLAISSTVLVLGTVFSPSWIGTTLLYSMVTLLFVYAFVASIHAWHVAERGIARERAGIFALAFGLRDIGWGISYAISAWLMWTQIEYSNPSDMFWLGKFVYALGTLLAIPLIAYGILRTQLFDIDLRIRWTIKQSTLAGIFVALMYLISEGAAQFLEAELGNFAGLLAAAVVVFFLAPLQRFAERVASAAMPNTKNTPEYVAFRKMQVYEVAFTEAQHEDGISVRERALLERLRDSLEISASDAQSIEDELQAAASS